MINKANTAQALTFNEFAVANAGMIMSNAEKNAAYAQYLIEHKEAEINLDTDQIMAFDDFAAVFSNDLKTTFEKRGAYGRYKLRYEKAHEIIAVEEKNVSQKPARVKNAPEPLVQFNYEQTRGIPNTFLRSALFAVGKKGSKRRYMKKEKIHSSGGFELTYTGEQLDQSDLDVLLGALYFARNNKNKYNCVNTCSFSANEMLSLLDQTNAGKNHDNLHTRLLRLKVTGIEVKYANESYTGSLINGFYRDEITKSYVVVFDPEILPLFAENQWSNLDMADRRKLKGQPLALWLHGFYLTHATPYPYFCETIKEICGSENASMSSFRSTMKTAAKLINEVTGWEISVDNKNNKVSINKHPKSNAQKIKTKASYSFKEITKMAVDHAEKTIKK